MTWSYTPERVIHHAFGVLAFLVLAFACVFAILRARERRRPPAPPHSSPIRLAWAVTLSLEVLLIVCTILGLWLHRERGWRDVWMDPYGPRAERKWGMLLLRTSSLLLPLCAVLVWSWAARQAARRPLPTGRHSRWALSALLLSGAALLVSLRIYGVPWK